MVLHLSTFLCRSPASLLARINLLSERYANQNLTLVFALSANFTNTEDLGQAVKKLTSLGATQKIGCLSGRFGNTKINANNMSNDVISLAIAVFDSTSVIPFRSTLPGKEEIQVGRWHSFRKKSGKEKELPSLQSGVSWQHAWNQDSQVPSLPAELREIDPSLYQSLLYFSDLAPEGLLSSLDNILNFHQLGLLASSTPFITGRPVTLFRDKEIFSSGAIGLALKSNLAASPEINFHGVRKLGEVMTVTQSDGNMVNALDNSNPTQLLLSIIKKYGLQPQLPGPLKQEEPFCLGTFSSTGKIEYLYRITAGDPLRGNLSVDSTRAPPVGTCVQFLHRTPTDIPNISIDKSVQSLYFLTVSDEFQHHPHNSLTSDERFELLLQDTFFAASENGFIFKKRGRDSANVIAESMKCSLAGSLGSLAFGK